MRVVAGAAGGLTLRVPPGGARPTMDKVKAAIFSSLGDMVVGARVLDLFAGSGGLAIEALSRGAASACLVENHRRAIECIRENLRRARMLQARVVQMDCFQFLEREPASQFDLILADPPYAKREGEPDYAQRLIHSEALKSRLAEGGIFVLERAPAGEVPGWEIVRARCYGTTEVLFLRHTDRTGEEQS